MVCQTLNVRFRVILKVQRSPFFNINNVRVMLLLTIVKYTCTSNSFFKQLFFLVSSLLTQISSKYSVSLTYHMEAALTLDM